jgi:hypothetical protein
LGCWTIETCPECALLWINGWHLQTKPIGGRLQTAAHRLSLLVQAARNALQLRSQVALATSLMHNFAARAKQSRASLTSDRYLRPPDNALQAPSKVVI